MSSWCPPGYFRDSHGRLCKLPPPGDAAAAKHAAERTVAQSATDRGPKSKKKQPKYSRRGSLSPYTRKGASKRVSRKRAKTSSPIVGGFKDYTRFMWPHQLRKLGMSCGMAVPRSGTRHLPLHGAVCLAAHKRVWLTSDNRRGVQGTAGQSRRSIATYHERCMDTMIESAWLDSGIRQCDSLESVGGRNSGTDDASGQRISTQENPTRIAEGSICTAVALWLPPRSDRSSSSSSSSGGLQQQPHRALDLP